MKIALLNLPFDNNYGGNLQRCALMKVLLNLGHDVTHINLRPEFDLPWYKKPYSYTKRIIQKYILSKNDIIIFREKFEEKKYYKEIVLSETFYHKYIKHSTTCYSINEINSHTLDKYEAYVVGSDQVWRKSMISKREIRTIFLDFVDDNTIKIAYAVSFGIDTPEFSKTEQIILGKLYGRFRGVSVREDSAIKLCKYYNRIQPKAQLVLDPTLLLCKEDYVYLINQAFVENNTKGKNFCYVLDSSINTNNTISIYSEKYNLEVVKMGLCDSANISIEQWLNNILNAEMVLTDSYHGIVFSIIFRRPFLFLGNERRGNARIQSLFNILGIKLKDDLCQAVDIDVKRLNEIRNDSINFILKNLK